MTLLLFLVRHYENFLPLGLQTSQVKLTFSTCMCEPESPLNRTKLMTLLFCKACNLVNPLALAGFVRPQYHPPFDGRREAMENVATIGAQRMLLSTVSLQSGQSSIKNFIVPLMAVESNYAIATIMDKFLWDTRIYFSPIHILRTSDASPLPPTQCWA